MLRDDSSLRFERACSSLARRPTITDRPPSTCLACMRARSISEATPARGNFAQSLQCSCEFTWTRRRLLEKSPPEGLPPRSRMLDEASPVSRCCFLASLRTTNTSKKYEPRVLLSKIPRLHESPQTSGSRRGRRAAGRPGGVCPVPSAHLGGAQKRRIT
jgi:hypothetical protein